VSTKTKAPEAPEHESAGVAPAEAPRVPEHEPEPAGVAPAEAPRVPPVEGATVYLYYRDTSQMAIGPASKLQYPVGSEPARVVRVHEPGNPASTLDCVVDYEEEIEVTPLSNYEAMGKADRWVLLEADGDRSFPVRFRPFDDPFPPSARPWEFSRGPRDGRSPSAAE
jgi:hypothetical protein